jgi:pyrimidine operon attenuation protein / uracil phosphoribosyltransferase
MRLDFAMIHRVKIHFLLTGPLVDTSCFKSAMSCRQHRYIREEICMRMSDTILDASDIDRILIRISHEILEIHKGAEGLALIGIQTRGVYLAQRLHKKIKEIEGAEIPVGQVDITLYRDDWTRISTNPVIQATEIPFSVDGKKIILVDDVLFTGRTVRCAMDALIDFGRPDRIELAVLVDRGHRELPIQGNYVGKFVETRRSETVNVMVTEYDGEDRVLIEKES